MENSPFKSGGGRGNLDEREGIWRREGESGGGGMGNPEEGCRIGNHKNGVFVSSLLLIKTEILYRFQRCCPMGVKGHVSHIIMDTSGNGTPQSVAYLYTEENAGKYNDFIHIFCAKTQIFRYRNL